MIDLASTSIVEMSRLELRNRIDPEFYSTEYTSFMQKLRSLEAAKVGSFCSVTSGSTPPDRNSGLKEGVLLLKTANIREGYIDIHSDEPFFIDSALDERLKSSRLKDGDVLVNIVGATLEVIGRAAIVPNAFPKANITQAMSLVRTQSHEFPPEYIFCFLHSRFGRTQISRMARPTAQYNLNHEETRSIVVPKASTKLKNELKAIVHEFNEAHEKAVNLYFQAEQKLLTELEFKNIQPKFEHFYVEKLVNAYKARRADPEFHQPFYEKLTDYIRSKGSYEVRQIQTANHRGVQPSYDAAGGAEAIRSEHLGRTSVDYEHLDKTSEDEWKRNIDAQVNQWDILTYTTGAYVGRTNCFLEQHKAIASNHVNILRIREIDSVYAAVFMNSTVGQLQLRRFVSGSAQPELYPSDISHFVIWKAPPEIQEQISFLVKESHKSRCRANELLLEATQKLEHALQTEIAKCQ